MNDLPQRDEIKRYVEKAYLANIMKMNDVRREREDALHASLSLRGHGRNSSACMICDVEIEEDCIAELLHQKADMYIDAYERKGLKIGPDVMTDMALSQVSLIATRKSILMAKAKQTASRTNSPSRAQVYAHLGKKVSVAMIEIGAKIDLYNLTPKKAEPMTVTNISYHLVNSSVTHGDDNSVNIINEKELFGGLTLAIAKAVEDETERRTILASLDELKSQKTKVDYLGAC